MACETQQDRSTPGVTAQVGSVPFHASLRLADNSRVFRDAVEFPDHLRRTDQRPAGGQYPFHVERGFVFDAIIKKIHVPNCQHSGEFALGSGSNGRMRMIPAVHEQ